MRGGYLVSKIVVGAGKPATKDRGRIERVETWVPSGKSKSKASKSGTVRRPSLAGMKLKSWSEKRYKGKNVSEGWLACNGTGAKRFSDANCAHAMPSGDDCDQRAQREKKKAFDFCSKEFSLGAVMIKGGSCLLLGAGSPAALSNPLGILALLGRALDTCIDYRVSAVMAVVQPGDCNDYAGRVYSSAFVECTQVGLSGGDCPELNAEVGASCTEFVKSGSACLKCNGNVSASCECAYDKEEHKNCESTIVTHCNDKDVDAEKEVKVEAE